jgi:hypothetical protein
MKRVSDGQMIGHLIEISTMLVTLADAAPGPYSRRQLREYARLAERAADRIERKRKELRRALSS